VKPATGLPIWAWGAAIATTLQIAALTRFVSGDLNGRVEASLFAAVAASQVFSSS
jgi:hypothetical protein